MASSSAAMSEKLQCSICLDVFNDPVSTPCGHNFCKICLNTYWDTSQYFSCPNCKETFQQRPKLKINITLRDFVDEYKKKTSKNQPDSAFLCDICDEVKLKAVKSCLMCQSSYCQTHLERHLTVRLLQKHKLIDPVNNLEDYICKKHEKPLEFFCRDDQTSVCLSCTDGDHKNHNTVTLEEEGKEKKIQLLKTQTDMQQKIQDKIKKIQDIKDSAELRRRNTQKQKEESVEIFRDLIQSIEKHQSELLKMMEEKEKSAEKHDEDLIKDLEQEITELQRRNIELEKISNTEDPLHLIQIYSSVSSPLNIKNRSEISKMSYLNVDQIKKSLTELQKILHDKLNSAVNTTGLKVNPPVNTGMKVNPPVNTGMKVNPPVYTGMKVNPPENRKIWGAWAEERRKQLEVNSTWKNYSLQSESDLSDYRHLVSLVKERKMDTGLFK